MKKLILIGLWLASHLVFAHPHPKNYDYQRSQAQQKLDEENCFRVKLEQCLYSVCRNHQTRESEDPDCENRFCKKQAIKACNNL